MSDDKLLLELGVTSDEESFSKAENLLDKLKGKFSSTDITLGIDKAIKDLKVIVDLWNGLENKVITTSVSAGDYLQYDITPGQKRMISGIDLSKTARASGLSSEEVLRSFRNIQTKQQASRDLGKLNETDWLVLSELAIKAQSLGLSEAVPFLGKELSDTIMYSDPMTVYTQMTNLVAAMQRKAYSLPKGAERSDIERKLAALIGTGYLGEGAYTYINLRTNPRDSSYGKRGNPLIPLLSGDPSDVGATGETLSSLETRALQIRANLDELTRQISRSTNEAGASIYDAIAGGIVTPLAQGVGYATSVLSGQKLNRISLPALSHVLKTDPFLKVPKTKPTPKGVASLFGYEEGFITPTIAEDFLVEELKQKATSNDPLTKELALYDLAVLAQATRGQITEQLASFTVDKLTRKVYGTKIDEAVKNAPRIKRKAVEEEKLKEYQALMMSQMADPNSSYYLSPQATQSEIYEYLRRQGILTNEDYNKVLARMINEPNAYIQGWYGLPEDPGRKAYGVSAESTKEGTLRIIVEDKINKETKTFEYTPGMTISTSDFDNIDID